jgi:hypothetical protein
MVHGAVYTAHFRHRLTRLDQPAPDFQVTTFDGKKLRLNDFKGQVLVLNFCAQALKYEGIIAGSTRTWSARAVPWRNIAVERNGASSRSVLAYR